MAVKTAAVSVSTTATRLDTFTEADYSVGSAAFAKAYGQACAVHNSSGVIVYVGGSDVTTGNGYPVAAGGDFAVDLLPGDALYGRVASGTAACTVVQAGV